jgi:hypothetical protein
LPRTVSTPCDANSPTTASPSGPFSTQSPTHTTRSTPARSSTSRPQARIPPIVHHLRPLDLFSISNTHERDLSSGGPTTGSRAPGNGTGLRASSRRWASLTNATFDFAIAALGTERVGIAIITGED